MFASFQTIDKVAKPLRVIKRNSIRGGVPDKLKIWWGKGVNCAKHKRHVAPNSRVNLGETVQCTVS